MSNEYTCEGGHFTLKVWDSLLGCDPNGNNYNSFYRKHLSSRDPRLYSSYSLFQKEPQYLMNIWCYKFHTLICNGPLCVNGPYCNAISLEPY